jgi:DNA-nicking Smr family endonuclease
MIIQGILQYQQREVAYKALKTKPRTSQDVQRIPQDTFEPAHKKPEIRQELVNTVKRKISRGYYSSETVLDDLGNSFARALNAAQQ